MSGEILAWESGAWYQEIPDEPGSKRRRTRVPTAKGRIQTGRTHRDRLGR